MQKRCIKGKESYNSYNRRIGYKKHYGISYLKRKAQNGRNGMRHISRSQCKNTLPIKKMQNRLKRRTTVKFNYRK